MDANISGNALTRAVVVAPAGMDTFSLELATGFTIDSAEIQLNNGGFQRATVVRDNGTAIDILMPSNAPVNTLVDARVYYHGSVNGAIRRQSQPIRGYFEGVPGYLPDFSASPPYNSSTWWPCKQNLTDKADSSWFFITTDTPNIAVSNGLLINTVNVSWWQKAVSMEVASPH